MQNEEKQWAPQMKTCLFRGMYSVWQAALCSAQESWFKFDSTPTQTEPNRSQVVMQSRYLVWRDSEMNRRGKHKYWVEPKLSQMLAYAKQESNPHHCMNQIYSKHPKVSKNISLKNSFELSWKRKNGFICFRANKSQWKLFISCLTTIQTITPLTSMRDIYIGPECMRCRLAQ